MNTARDPSIARSSTCNHQSVPCAREPVTSIDAARSARATRFRSARTRWSDRISTGAREPVDHLGQDQRGKISQRSPGRHGRLLNAGPPEATNWTASAVNGSGAHKKSGNERAAGKRHGNTEHLQWSTFAEARSAGTLSRQQQAPVHHDHEFALFCRKFVAKTALPYV